MSTPIAIPSALKSPPTTVRSILKRSQTTDKPSTSLGSNSNSLSDAKLSSSFGEKSVQISSIAFELEVLKNTSEIEKPPTLRRKSSVEGSGEILNDILHSTTQCALFQNYLHSVHSEENLLFWKEIQAFRELGVQKSISKKSNHSGDSLDGAATEDGQYSPSNTSDSAESILSSSPNSGQFSPNAALAQQRKRKAKTIWEKFFSETSKYQVNVDIGITQKIFEQLENPNPFMFDAAQEWIFNLMKEDLLPKYINSNIYKKYLEQCSSIKQTESNSIEMGSKVIIKDHQEFGVGTVLFVGEVKNEKGNFVGIAFENPVGDCDGSIGSDRYFGCEPDHGIFLKLENVVPIQHPQRRATAFATPLHFAHDKLEKIMRKAGRTFSQRVMKDEPPKVILDRKDTETIDKFVALLLSPAIDEKTVMAKKRDMLAMSLKGPGLRYFAKLLNEYSTARERACSPDSNAPARKWRLKFDNTADLRVRSKSVDKEKLKSAIPLEKDLLIMLDRQMHNEDKICITTISFDILIEIVQTSLIAATHENDFIGGRELLFTSTKYYRNEGGTPVFVRNKIKNVGMWRNLRFWEEIMHDIKRKLNLEIEKEFAFQLKNFIIMMISCDVLKTDIYTFINKQCIGFAQTLEMPGLEEVVNGCIASFNKLKNDPNFDCYQWIQESLHQYVSKAE